MAEAVRLSRPLPPEIEEAWAIVTDPARSFEVRLSASDELRRRLGLFAGQLVEDARREGATWAEIGAALEVSKQAAQQRFGW